MTISLMYLYVKSTQVEIRKRNLKIDYTVQTNANGLDRMSVEGDFEKAEGFEEDLKGEIRCN